MAYLDDNNNGLENSSSPLDELDKELADLRAALGELSTEDNTKPKIENNAAEIAKTADTAADTAAEKGPHSACISAKADKVNIDDGIEEAEKVSGNTDFADDNPYAVDSCFDENDSERITENDMKTKKKPAHSAEKAKKTRLPLIITASALAVVLMLGAVYAVMKFVIPNNNDGSTEATASGEMVTINDSVMGDIELKTVKGAQVNTLTAENLTYNENGYPEYYEGGKKISHLGIDLSEYQGDPDFEALKNAGVEFAMLRIGGRYYGDNGGVYEDSAFESHYEQAKAAGLKVGVYFFSQATSTADAVEEAKFTLGKLSGKSLDYPVAFDWENIADDEARTDNITGEELTLIAEAFCDTVKEAGYYPIVYSNTQQMFVMYDFETMKDYDFWLADYREFPTMYYKFDMWQYTMNGTVDGVDGTVDLNLSFTDFS